MSLNIFQHPYAFHVNPTGIEIEDEETHTSTSIPLETMKMLFSQLQQRAETTHRYHTNEEIDRCITNLSKMQEIGSIAELAQATEAIFQDVKKHLHSDAERRDHLVDALYQFLPTTLPIERRMRQETVRGLAEYKKPPQEDMSRHVEELQTLLGTAVEPVHAGEWILLKTLIREIAYAQNLDEEQLTDKIIRRLRSELKHEDLLYLLHLSIGGLLAQDSLTPRIKEIKKELQNTYETWTQEAASRSSEMFQAGKRFEEVLQFVQEGRQKIAYACYHFPPDPFGRRRYLSLYTPVEGKYLPWLPKIVELATEPYHTIKGFEDFDNLETSTLKTRTIYAQINHRMYPLTSFIVSTKHQSDESYTEVMYLDEPGQDVPDYVRATICHTPPKAYPLIMRYLEYLTRSFLNSRMHVIARAAKIHWFFAHLCPLDRGSAAVGEVMLKGLLETKGIQIEWNKQSPPDLYLLTTPDVREAEKRYPECFTRLEPSP